MRPRFEPVDVRFAPSHRSGATLYRHTGRFDRSWLTVTYALNEDEHSSRQTQGLGAVTNERLLAALLAAPHDDLAPVPALFDDAFGAPNAHTMAVVIEDVDGTRWAQRTLQAPLEIIEIEARARDWESGSAVVHDWAGYGARSVRVEHLCETGAPWVLIQAAHYGIGLIDGCCEHQLLAPGEYRSERWTSARWRFAEMVYRQFLTASENV